MDLKEKSINIRKTILEMICKSKSSHIGSAFSVVDVLTYIYFQEFKKWDKLILSKWHAGSSLYATLAELWKIDKTELINTYCQNWQKLWWHVTLWSIDGVDATAGSLWHGLPIGIWMAMVFKNNKVYVIIWDGEMNEWSIWEWIMFLSHHKINNLILIIDKNKQQWLGHTKDIVDTINIKNVLSWFDINVVECNWNNLESIEESFKNLSKYRANIIIANTIKGKWVSFMEDNIDFHYKTPNEEQYNQALFELNNN